MRNVVHVEFDASSLRGNPIDNGKSLLDFKEG